MHRLVELTAREKEVLSWIREGKTNDEIAIVLEVSVRTVTTHVGKILKKLHVENRTAAALLYDEFSRNGSTRSKPDRKRNALPDDGSEYGPILAD